MKGEEGTRAGLWDGWQHRKSYSDPRLRLYYQVRARNLEWLAERSLALLDGGARPRILKTDLWNEAKKDEFFFAHADAVRFGVDIARGVCHAARQRWNDKIHIARGSIVDLPFRGGCFDAVWDISTLDHCRTPELAVGEYFRVLRHGGNLLLVTENPFCVSFPITRLQALLGLHVPFTAFLPSRVAAMCTSAGFHIVDTFRTNIHLPTWIVYPLERRGKLESLNRGRGRFWNLCKKYVVFLAHKSCRVL